MQIQEVINALKVVCEMEDDTSTIMTHLKMPGNEVIEDWVSKVFIDVGLLFLCLTGKLTIHTTDDEVGFSMTRE